LWKKFISAFRVGDEFGIIFSLDMEDRSKPNPSYVSAPYECAGWLNGVYFLISENSPVCDGDVWIKMPEREARMFINGAWTPVEPDPAWYAQLPFPPAEIKPPAIPDDEWPRRFSK